MHTCTNMFIGKQEREKLYFSNSQCKTYSYNIYKLRSFALIAGGFFRKKLEYGSSLVLPSFPRKTGLKMLSTPLFLFHHI